MTRPAASERRVAVIGSGPSGFYTSEALLRSGVPMTIDMFERLPVPYGLVRFGVAPDHPKLKQVTTAFDRIAAMPGFHFIGGVTVGDDVTVDELRMAYDAVVLATGAELSQALDVPGETLPGNHSAGDFVAWYNGHPEFRDRQFDFGHEAAVVIGHGNVALDVARILAKTADELRRTDIARHALEALAESRVREIYVVGRGGPARAKFTAKELRDFVELAACDTRVDLRDVTPDEFEPQRSDDPETNEKLSLLRAFSQQAATRPRRCVFRFGLSPVAIRGRDRIETISFKHRSGVVEDIACGLSFSSIGRRTMPVAGVPYDAHRGVHANIDGRVAIGSALVEGLYVCGWSKRGPNGTIGTNRGCGIATAEALLADLSYRRPRSDGRDALLARLAGRAARLVSYPDWMTIDAAEKRRGAALGKPREKFVTIPDMLAALDTCP
ncbi:FAD-dependent oxidoreductase [Bradyrhizobium manausense]|uniref:FAD-dependent oxidoreductase n=1 Tax=Bradyrhizobium manausense TaxID=989370 RepID=UPI001BAB036F|nr:FAD-dependent oxidoreductase [Bradyrhizobium manausense]MBR0721894.1 FAD-dependent oxidoreductase [Bradyrhizobium manausense]